MLLVFPNGFNLVLSMFHQDSFRCTEVLLVHASVTNSSSKFRARFETNFIYCISEF